MSRFRRCWSRLCRIDFRRVLREWLRMGKLFFSFMPPPPLYFTASTTTTENTIISTFPRDRDFFLHKLMFLSGSGQVGREREGRREFV